MEVRAITLDHPDTATLVAVGELFLKVLARLDTEPSSGCKPSVGVPTLPCNPRPTSPDSTTPGLQPGEGRDGVDSIELGVNDALQ